FQIVAFGLKEAVKFPFGVGFQLLFVAAGWLIPGLVAITARRELHGPWLGAFVAGIFLTGIGSQGWLHYYTPFVPFCSILISVAIGLHGKPSLSPYSSRSLAWALVLGTTVLWSPALVWRN